MVKRTPFSRLLVANRGEIALRVMRTARDMGLETVAVWSEADRGAAHVRAADRAVCIGAAAPAESYLNIGRIIDAARAGGADALHPGYGFLAENPALARACAEAGIVFVGPTPEAIARMGDKAAAKAAMAAAGVPVVPGYDGADQDPAVLAQEAVRIGYPLMIKAVAGGGGRGMRLVTGADGFADSLRSAVNEAQTAFGDGRVLLERAIVDPRHVEIQVLADRHGNVLHCGERDCSVQRRHQKLIEEAPSPAVDADLRARMGAVSVAAARAIGYEGAGTFEYLLDADGAFWFMEMNTRLQVEHPVTEAITGLDLVALQLRIAAGEPLPLTQDQVRLHGHAIEARLCAEDADAGFLPQAGRMLHWRPAPGLRVDHALDDGAAVPAAYDSMIAKLVAHGPDRATALHRLASGLRRTQALGLRTNQAFLAACLDHPVFAAGAATTGFIEAHRDTLLPDRTEAGARAAMIAAALLRAGPETGLAHGFPTPLRLARDGQEHQIRVQAFGHGDCVAVSDDGRLEIQVGRAEGISVPFTVEGVERAATLLRDGDRVWLHLDGQAWDFEDLSHVPEITANTAGDGTLRAAMSGTVATVHVAAGDEVAEGDVLVVLEAMKMEHAHTAPMAGRVRAVHVTPASQVVAQAVLVELESDADSAE